MRLSLLCIGDELLKGVTVNTNASYIGQQLLELGVIPENSLVTPDEPSSLKMALEYLYSHSDIVITTGGLGPTADDMTCAVTAEFIGRKLVYDKAAEANIRDYWAKRRKEMPEIPQRILDQALIPEGAEGLHNSQGTAPGIWVSFSLNGSTKYLGMLPGPPREMKPLFTHEFIPRLRQLQHSTTHNRLFYVAGVPESIVEDRMQPVIASHDDLSVAYCASYEGVKLFLKSSCEKTIAEAVENVIDIFGHSLLPEGKLDLAENIVHLLHENSLTLSCAESCTGGKIAARIVDVSGSSTVFPGSYVVYSNDWKSEQLNVSEETLREHGAVSEECVRELVTHLCTKHNVDSAIAVSGIAGPGGGTLEKPVGLVYIAVKAREKTVILRQEFRGDRTSVRDRTVAKSLNTLRTMILES